MSPSLHSASASSASTDFALGTSATSRLGIDLDAVDLAITAGNRLERRGETTNARVAMDVRRERRGPQRLDHVRRRADLGVAATKVDHGRPGLRGGSGDPAEKGDEVLLGQASQAIGTGAHAGDRISSAPLVGELRRSTVVLRRPPTAILTLGACGGRFRA